MTGAAREAILDAAFRLFLEHGYEATSLSRILATVPYSKGAVYHHFANKEALLEAVVERFFAAPIAESTSAGAASGSELAHRLVDDYLGTLDAVGEFASPGRYYAFMTAIAPRARDAIRRAQDETVARLAEALAEEGVADPAAVARDVVALIEGAGMLAVLRGERPDGGELHEAVDRTLAGTARSAGP